MSDSEAEDPRLMSFDQPKTDGPAVTVEAVHRQSSGTTWTSESLPGSVRPQFPGDGTNPMFVWAAPPGFKLVPTEEEKEVPFEEPAVKRRCMYQPVPDNPNEWVLPPELEQHMRA